MTQANFLASLIGQVLDGKYRLDSLLGKGGMGAVFRAQHLTMDRRVAIKVIHAELAADPAVARRFVREARGTFRVDSPHAIKVLDFAESEQPAGLLYMVMEHLDGRTVARELVVDGALAPRRALHVARQVAEALGAAHRIGIIHRDIKPDNVMLIRQGDDPDFAKVLDFGLAKLIEGAKTDDAGLSAARLTRQGMVFGTPEYMSPEQATGQPLDAHTDLYALGATLFEMLTARPVFPGKTAMQVLVQHVKAQPPHLGDVAPALAPYEDLDDLVQRLLAKAKSDRPVSAVALAREIDGVMTTLPASGKPAGPAHSPTMQLPAADRSTRGMWMARLTPEGDPVPEEPPSLASATTWPEPPRSTPVSGIADGLEPEEPPPGVSRPVRVRRWPALFVGAIAIGGVIAVAVIASQQGGDGGGTSRRTSMSDAAPVALPVEAPVVDAAPVVVVVPADAAAAAPPDDAAPRVADRDRDREREREKEREREREAKKQEEITRHLAIAEAAFRVGAANKKLKQMTHADEVLKLDRNHARANFLMGDALIDYKDPARGCAYLRKAAGKGVGQARTRMTEAGCK